MVPVLPNNELSDLNLYVGAKSNPTLTVPNLPNLSRVSDSNDPQSTMKLYMFKSEVKYK